MTIELGGCEAVRRRGAAALRVRGWPLWLAAVIVASGTATAPAVTQFERGAEAPGIELTALDGSAFNLAELKGRVVVVVFGELYHERTLQACEHVQTVLKDKRLAGAEIVSVLIVAQDADVEQLTALAEDKPVPPVILHDAKRQVFGRYRVAVLPSVVVIDGKGRVVHAMASLSMRFADVLTDALLLATGQLEAEQFEQNLTGPTAALTAEQARARRLTRLAGQLVRRNLSELALEKYAEALEADPQYAPAHLGLGMLHLQQRHLAKAEQRFQAVLEHDADSVEAALGLAFVQTQRGDAELVSAEKLVRRVLAKRKTQPRAHYLLGVIHERRDDTAAAAASYKKAAELLMEQRDLEARP